MLRIKLVRSPIGNSAHARRIVRALGLRKLNSAVLHPDNPSIRGMIHRVAHLLAVEPVEGVEAKPQAKGKPRPKPEKASKEAPKQPPTEAASPSGEAGMTKTKPKNPAAKAVEKKPTTKPKAKTAKE